MLKGAVQPIQKEVNTLSFLSFLKVFFSRKVIL